MRHSADVLDAEADYYELLGVQVGATSEEIKYAYRGCCKRHHPDRFAGSTDDAAVDAATAMMARINLAYATLNDPEQRHLYDHRRRQRLGAGNRFLPREGFRASGEYGDRQSSPCESGPMYIDAGAPIGLCQFSDLSPARQKKLRRLRERSPDRLKLKRRGWLGAALLLTILAMSLAAMLLLAPGRVAGIQQWSVAAALAAAAGGCIGGCGYRLVRLARSDMGILHVFNPLYLIRANGEEMTWYRLADITAIRFRHPSIGGFMGIRLEMDLAGQTLAVQSGSRRRTAWMLRTLRKWKQNAEDARARGDAAYFEQHGIFAGLSDHRRSRRLTSRRRRQLAYCVFVAIALALMAVAGATALPPLIVLPK